MRCGVPAQQQHQVGSTRPCRAAGPACLSLRGNCHLPLLGHLPFFGGGTRAISSRRKERDGRASAVLLSRHPMDFGTTCPAKRCCSVYIRVTGRYLIPAWPGRSALCSVSAASTAAAQHRNVLQTLSQDARHGCCLPGRRLLRCLRGRGPRAGRQLSPLLSAASRTPHSTPADG